MATWDSYTQKATPEDNDTLMIKDTVGAANKRTPFSGVWNWIVNKLTSAVISNLQTNSKSIIPAINELNSKIIANQKNYNNANGESIFNIIDIDANNGLYCYYNISDIPESSGASNEYIRILKMHECMFIIRNNSYAYFTTASSGTWGKNWYKFAVTLVQ